jgi:hypothetical protein
LISKQRGKRNYDLVELPMYLQHYKCRAATTGTLQGADALASIVSQLAQRQGGVEALERKLVTWSTSRSQLPADGEYQLTSGLRWF